MAFRTMQAVLMNCPINYKEKEEVQSGKPRLRPAGKPVLTKKTASWKKDHMTLSHTPQECVGQNRSNSPRHALLDALGVA
jgi:hypothetical protein